MERAFDASYKFLEVVLGFYGFILMIHGRKKSGIEHDDVSNRKGLNVDCISCMETKILFI